MFQKTKNNNYFFKKLSEYPRLVHGFSTRQFGDLSVRKTLNENNKLDGFLKVFGLTKSNLIMMEQVHGGKVKIVKDEDKGEVIKAVDGLVTDQPGIILGVKVADCMPLLFFDPKKKIIGIAHAGWKGVLLEIAKEMVERMKMLGSQPKDVFVGAGPHIGGCCYSVDKERKNKFIKKFGDLSEMILKNKNKFYLNLAVPLKVQLIEQGIQNKNIEFSTACTSCQIDEFFSYRRDSEETYGEILGIISLID